MVNDEYREYGSGQGICPEQEWTKYSSRKNSTGAISQHINIANKSLENVTKLKYFEMVVKKSKLR
jgi:hypothetical protein